MGLGKVIAVLGGFMTIELLHYSANVAAWKALPVKEYEIADVLNLFYRKEISKDEAKKYLKNFGYTWRKELREKE